MWSTLGRVVPLSRRSKWGHGRQTNGPLTPTRATATFVVAVALVLGVGVTPAHASPAISADVVSFSRNTTTGTASYAVNVDATDLSSICTGSCKIQLEVRDTQGTWTVVSSQWWSGSSYSFSGNLGWGTYAYDGFRARVTSGSSPLISSVVSVSDSVRTQSIDVSNVSFTRNSTTANVPWTATIDVSAVPSSACTGWNCYLKLVAEDVNHVEYVLYQGTISNYYTSSYNWSGNFSTWSAIYRVQARYGSVSSSWVDVEDSVRTQSIGVSNVSFTRNSTTANVPWTATIDVSAVPSSACTGWNCYLKLVAEDVNHVEYVLYQGTISNYYTSSYNWSGNFSTWSAIYRVQARYGSVSSSWVDVEDSVRTPGLTLSDVTFNRNQETGSAVWAVTVGVSAVNPACGSSWCKPKLIAEDENGTEYVMYEGGITNFYNSTLSWGANFGTWKKIVRIQARYESYHSNWVSVSDSVRPQSLTLKVDKFSRASTASPYLWAIRLDGAQLNPSLCTQFGGCLIQVIGEDANGYEHQLTGFTNSTPYHGAFQATGSYWGTKIVRVQARYGTFLSHWIDTTTLRDAEAFGGFNPAEKNCACSHGDPVNTATGEFYLPANDDLLAGVGPALQVTRTYSTALVAQDGPFGYGWSTSFTSKLVIVTAGDLSDPLPRVVDVVQENGASVRFTEQADHTYTAPSRVFATLSYDDGSEEWTFLRNTNEVLTFDSSGALISVKDLNGNTVTLTYSSGQVVSLTASGGRSITLAWASGHVTALSDSAGREVAYSYDSSGNLTGVTAVDGAESSYGYDAGHYMTSLTKPGGGTTTNEYDSSHRVISQTDPINRELTFSYATSQTTTTGWDGSQTVETYLDGRVISQTKAAGTASEATTSFVYDASGNILSTTDPLNNITTFTYDDQGNPLTKTDALSQTTTWTYNALNEVTSVTDPLDREMTLAYDGEGNLTSTTSPGGRVTTFTYNSDGTAATLVDARGKTTTFAYDSAGRLTSTTDPDSRTKSITYNTAGFVTTTTDADSNITTYTTDDAGRVLTVTDPLSHVTIYAYDDDGNLVSTEDANSHTTSSVYDVAGQVTSTTDARGKTTTFTYTAGGYLSTVTDPDSRTTTRTYDLLGRVVTVTDPDSNATTFAYDLNGRQLSVTLPSAAVSTATYDAVGQLVTSTNGNGKTTTYAHDAAGQVTSVTDPLSRVTSTTYTDDGQVDTVTLADSSTQSYVYNLNGQVISFTDPDSNVTTYSYDDAGLLTSKTAPGSITTVYSYDDAGRLETTTLPDSTTVTNSYDDASRLILQEFSAFGATDLEFEYDAVGARTSMTDASGSSTYTYNANNQLTGQTNGANQSLTYSYTNSGLLASITYPGSDTVDYSYTTAGRLGSVTDWNSNTTTYTWNVDGQLATQTGPNGVTQTHTYDSAGQTTDLTIADGISTLAEYGYGYDDAGQLVSDTTTDPILSAVSHTYTYDALNQVLSRSDGTMTVSYDPTSAGQLEALGGDTLTYNSAQQLTGLTPATGPATSYTYDANGSRTNATIAAASPDPAQSTDYGYDAALNLATVTLPGDTTPTVSYTSNGDGLRQSRTEASTTTDLLWSTAGGLPLLMDDGTSTYIYGTSSTPIAQITGSTTTYLYGDLLGSVRLITDDTGATVGTNEYDTYGNKTDHTGTTDSLIGYTGNWTDPTTNLIYLRARDYDTTTGQFLVVDPAVGRTQQPYAYVGNDPLLQIDPTGLCPESQPACDFLGDLSNPYDNLNNMSHGAWDTLTWSPIGALIFGDPSWSLSKGVRNAFPEAFSCPDPNAFYVYGSLAAGIPAAGGELAAGMFGSSAAARSARASSELVGKVAAPTPVVATHGNSASSSATAYLYRLSTGGTGEYLKTGISQAPMSRYGRTFMQDKQIEVLQSGTRREMLNLERYIVERDPGPLNFEPWAGKFAGDMP